MSKKIIHFDLPTISYEEGLKKQKDIHEKVVFGDIGAAILSLSHTPVLTLGKHADKKFLLKSPEELAAQGVDLVETDRGGEVTAHMPGQLVIYPILPLKDFGLGPKSLVDKVLLGSVIKLLESHGISSSLDHENPGVWVDDRKICAVGIRVSRRVSSPGIALNINNDLGVFDLIVPCGISNKQVTSMSKELGKSLNFETIKEELLLNIYESLGQAYSRT